MTPLYSADISTVFGQKNISVYAQSVLDFPERIDILTTSAFRHSYAPTPRTLFSALDSAGISVAELSEKPYIDLRDICGVWLSNEIALPFARIKRIGCVEMSRYTADRSDIYGNEQSVLNTIKAYFQMLDIASTAGVKMDTVAMPLLGGGSQQISGSLTLYPILNECVSFLKRNESVKRIYFIDINQNNAFQFAQTMNRSYSLFATKASISEQKSSGSSPMAFISYSSADRNIADNLCNRLESRGVKVWYAPRNVHGDYATSIANAIDNSTHFIVILSKNSIISEHVLNEIDLAFSRLPNNIRFKPLRIDTHALAPAFNYYLSRQHWMDAHIPPIEQRLDEYVDSFMEDLQ